VCRPVGRFPVPHEVGSWPMHAWLATGLHQGVQPRHPSAPSYWKQTSIELIE